MNAEDGNTLYDVRNRLRHRSIQTTEQVYDHMIEYDRRAKISTQSTHVQLAITPVLRQ